MVDIQSATAEIRRGKKERQKEEETTGQKYNGLAIKSNPAYILLFTTLMETSGRKTDATSTTWVNMESHMKSGSISHIYT